MAGTSFLSVASETAMWVMTLSLLFPLYRLLRGPGLPDRVIALDQIAMIVIGIIICDAVYSNDHMLLDVVLIIAFILVFGAIIIAHYLHKKQLEE
jgi:multicomponent Na+:H+ antiporter subunit F